MKAYRLKIDYHDKNGDFKKEDGDEYYTVFSKGKLHIKPMTVYGAFKFNELYIFNQTKDDCKYFKHKGSAERFVELNTNKLIQEGLEERCKELISFLKENKLNYKIKIKENKFKIER